MAITVTVNDTLTLDQTAGVQSPTDGNDVSITYAGNVADPLGGGLDAEFLTYLNGLGLNDAQKEYAALVDGASSGDDCITVTASNGEELNNLFLSDADGNALNGDLVASMETLANEPLYFHSDPANSDFVLVTTSATAGAGRIVGAIYLDEASDFASGQVQMVTFEAIQHPTNPDPDDTLDFTDALQVSSTGSLTFDFDALKSGSSLWCAVGNSTAGLLITGGNPLTDAANKKTNVSDVIHTSQGGDGATIGVNNQLFDNVGETAVFTLVTGLTTLSGADAGATGDYTVDPRPGDNKPEGIDYAGYINTSGAGIYISQSQGNDLKDLDINVFETGGNPGSQTAEDGANYIPGLNNDAEIDVATVTVYDQNGDPIGTWGVGGLANGVAVGDVSVSIDGHNIDANGLQGGYTINWTVVGGETFNRFEVVGEAGQFDIGRVLVDEGARDSEGLGADLLVDDDGPTIGNIVSAIVEFSTGASGTVTRTLNGAVGTDANGSPYALTDWTGKDAGDPAIVVNSVTLKAVANATGADPVTAVSYWADTNGDTVFGNAGDTEFYRLTLDQSGAGTYTWQVLQNPPIAEVQFTFADQPAGQNLFGIIATNKGNIAPDSTLPDGGLLFFNKGAILVDGAMTSTSSTVNTSKGGGEVSIGFGANNYTADNQDCFFIFADNPNSNGVGGLGLTQTKADDADNIRINGTNEVSSASVEIVKIVGSSESGVTVKAWDLDDGQMNINSDALARELVTNPLTAGANDAVQANINGLRVFSVAASGTTLVYSAKDANSDGDFTDSGEILLNTGNVSVTENADGSVTVLGLDTNKDYTIRYDTVAPHDMAEIQWETGSYNIGGFNVIQALDTPDQRFDFVARATDGDGDFASDNWSIGVDGTGIFNDDAVSGVIV